jgi:site-specific DNA-methyltransferase (adenine-specific)
MWEIVNNDVMTWARTYKGPKFHAMLTDCPYEYGFMGKSWDSSGVSFDSSTWTALAEHLYPGAFGMTYGGARTYHRIAVAIEDAGLIIHPSIFGWVYSSGFPKATRIDDKIDKAAGKYEEREVLGKHDNPASEIFRSGKMSRDVTLTIPATEKARAFEGHRYGLQALKPALEPIILFQKPYVDKAYEDIAEFGAGALWIDGTRINDGSILTFEHTDTTGAVRKSPKAAGHPVSTERRGMWINKDGRWPANFAAVHHLECTIVGSKEKDGYVINRWDDGAKPFGGGAGLPFTGFLQPTTMVPVWECHPDCQVQRLGERAEYFFQADWSFEVMEGLDNTDSIFYSSKPPRSEKEAGLDDEPIKTLKELSGGGGFAHEYQTAYQARKTDRKNPHPTIKPIGLNRWLASMLLPPELYAPRRLLVPFSGVSSEGIGGILSGWEFVEMIEIEAEHCELGAKRAMWWEAMYEKYGVSEPAEVIQLGKKEMAVQTRIQL